MNEEIITDEILINELHKRLDEYKKALHDVKELNKELQLVNKKLLESDAMKGHFISNITNEIINPFASIIGLSRNILSIREGDWERVKKVAKLINSEAFSLDFQLRNIFAAAEIESGEVYPQVSNVDVKLVIQGVLGTFEQEIEKKQLKIEYLCKKSNSESLFFKTDSEKLKIILSNLISNAIKFSYDKGTVEIMACQEVGNLLITVKDYGIGISDENQQIIFDRFKRLDSGINSINRGHGLGLSINKAYIDQLDGSIEIESSEHNGAKFIVTIPVPKGEVEGFSTDGNEIFFGDDEIF